MNVLVAFDFYCCDYELSSLKLHMYMIPELLLVSSPGTAWLEPLLGVPQAALNAPGLHLYLELGVLFQAHSGCWQNSGPHI